jgi:hypothetical protein
VVETVEITTITTRPLSLAAVSGCLVPVAGASAYAAAQSAVSTRVRTAPIFGSGTASTSLMKINTNGMALPLANGPVSVMRDHQVQAQLVKAEGVKAQGVKATDARGVPPRGEPV